MCGLLTKYSKAALPLRCFTELMTYSLANSIEAADKCIWLCIKPGIYRSNWACFWPVFEPVLCGLLCSAHQGRRDQLLLIAVGQLSKCQTCQKFHWAVIKLSHNWSKAMRRSLKIRAFLLLKGHESESDIETRRMDRCSSRICKSFLLYLFNWQIKIVNWKGDLLFCLEMWYEKVIICRFLIV